MKQFGLLLSLCACSSSLEPTSTVTVPQCTQQASASEPMPHEDTMRVQMKFFIDDDGGKHPVGLFDSVRRESCEYRTAADGVVRCLPITDATMFQSFYADPHCTIPVAVTGHAVQGVRDEAPVIAELKGEGAQIHVYGISHEYTLDALALNVAGEWTLYRRLVDFYVWDPAWQPSPLTLSCAPISPSIFERYWIVGAEIPPAEFAALPEGRTDAAP